MNNSPKAFVGKLLAIAVLSLAAPLAHAQSPALPTKVSVSILYIAADAGLFTAVEKGYFKEQGIELDLQRMTSGADAIALLATNKLDVGSGSLTPGLLNALRRGMPIQIVAEKARITSIGERTPSGAGGLLVRNDLVSSGQVKGPADLKGKRIGINNLESTTLNYVMRGLAKAGLGREDVTLVEMPFNQFVPALQRKAVDAVVAFSPLIQALEKNLKLGTPMPEMDLYVTAPDTAANIMMYSAGFAKTDAAKRFMVAHLKGQRELMRLVQTGQREEACRVVAKHVSSMPTDCADVNFSGVDANGAINVESMEEFQREWIRWAVMKEPADLRKSVNPDFVQHAVKVLGAAR
jgi:ABC-type nitrate/sulfonate/bicarbonate transport system substrate-binding protein